MPEKVSAEHIVIPRPMNANSLVNLCRDTPRIGGNPVYPDTDFVELPSDDPVLFSVDRVGESRQFVHDFLCPATLAEMMIIVHDIRAQIACHGPVIIEPVIVLNDPAVHVQSSSTSAFIHSRTSNGTTKSRTNNYD